MIKKTFYLLILFLLVFLAAHINTQYLPYIGITAVFIIILCLGYAIHKTKLFYYSKKVIVFLLFSLSFFYLTSASPVLAQTSETTQSGGTFFKSLFSQDAKPSLEEQIQKVGNEFHKIWRILPETRTEEQQKKYDQLKKQLENLLKKKAKEDKKEKAKTQCKTPHELLREVQNDCWSCDLTYIIIEAIDGVATSFFNKVQENNYALIILGLGFAFWLLFNILKFFTSWLLTDLGEVWTTIFRKLILVIFAAALLISPIRQVFDWILTPFFSFSAAISMEIANISTFGNNVSKIDESLSKTLEVNPIECSYCTAMKKSDAAVPSPKNIENVDVLNAPSIQDRVFSSQIKNSMLCIVCSLYRTISPPIIIGQSLLCYSTTEGAYSFPPKWIIGVPVRLQIPNMLMYTAGIVIIIVFILITILFPLFLVDAFFRIGYVATLMPFLIVAYVFESTRIYAKNSFRIVLHSLSTFLFVSIMFTLLVQIFYTSLSSDTQAITNALASNDIKSLFNIFVLNSGFFPLLMCIFIGFLAVKMMFLMDEISSELTAINLESTGGIGALISAIDVIKSPMPVVSEIYDETWGYVGSKRVPLNAPELPKYHSAEAKSRLIRLKSYQKFNKYADSVVSFGASPALSVEEEIQATGNVFSNKIYNFRRSIIHKINEIGKNSTEGLKRTGTEINSLLSNIFGLNNVSKTPYSQNKDQKTNKKVQNIFKHQGSSNILNKILNLFALGSNVIILPLIVLTKTVQFASLLSVKALFGVISFVTRKGTYVTQKTASAAISLPGRLTALGLQKAGKLIAQNKYFTKTAGATNSLVLGAIAGTVLGIAHFASGLGSLVPGSSRSKKGFSLEGRDLSSKENELRVARIKLQDLHDKRRSIEVKRYLLLGKGVLSEKDTAELASIESDWSQMLSEITYFESIVASLESEVSHLKENIRKHHNEQKS